MEFYTQASLEVSIENFVPTAIVCLCEKDSREKGADSSADLSADLNAHPTDVSSVLRKYLIDTCQRMKDWSQESSSGENVFL